MKGVCWSVALSAGASGSGAERVEDGVRESTGIGRRGFSSTLFTWNYELKMVLSSVFVSPDSL